MRGTRKDNVKPDKIIHRAPERRFLYPAHCQMFWILRTEMGKKKKAARHVILLSVNLAKLSPAAT
jgi:hypothetical protein